jgi:membrane-anchored glycerophosphoryl diester phosphodiesterase (GDPDase)
MPYYFTRAFSYCPDKPRHPLMKLLFGMAGLLLLVFLLVFGVFIGLGMLVFAAIRRMRRRPEPIARPQSKSVLDAEYTVLNNS